MSTIVKLILVGIVGFVLFLSLDGPEHVRKVLNPVDYWTKKRDKAQEMVEFYSNEMRSCRLEFKKLRLTKDITIRQAIITGSTPQEAREEFKDEWEALKEACSMMSELLDMTEADLEHANGELAKHQ